MQWFLFLYVLESTSSIFLFLPVLVTASCNGEQVTCLMLTDMSHAQHKSRYFVSFNVNFAVRTLSHSEFLAQR